MSKLPSASGKECVKALEKAGFEIRRQTGSHIIMQRKEPFSQVVVPNHKSLQKGTLRGIIKDTGLSVDEFTELLD